MARSYKQRWQDRWGDAPADPKHAAAPVPTEAVVAATPEPEPETEADRPNDTALSDAAAGFAREELRSFVERVERLEEEKKTIGEDIKDVFAEAKGRGFDTKALRAVIKRRKQDADVLAEHEATVDLYLQALGMTPIEASPLGRGAPDAVEG